MKINVLIIFIISAFFSTKSIAQHKYSALYKSAIGVKFFPGGITFKQALTKSTAFEAIGYFWNGNRITGLYELHYRIEGLSGLRWYIGPGAHVSFYNAKYYSGNTHPGLDGVIGLDWKVKGTPLDLSLDWQPSIEFQKGAGFEGGWGGMSVRYVLR